jgi:hypothetical protein
VGRSIPQMARMSQLSDQALALDAAGRRAWLERLAHEHQDLAPALRQALRRESHQQYLNTERKYPSEAQASASSMRVVGLLVFISSPTCLCTSAMLKSSSSTRCVLRSSAIICRPARWVRADVQTAATRAASGRQPHRPVRRAAARTAYLAYAPAAHRASQPDCCP